MSSMSGSMGYSGAAGSPMVSGAGIAGNKTPKGYKQGQIQQYTPEQMQLFQQSLGNAGPQSYLSKLAGGDQSFYDEMEAPAFRQFQQLQGQTASRFSGAGLGARRGSGFQNEINAQTSNFAQDLAARRHDIRTGAIKDLHNMSQDLLGNRPYENFLVEKQQKKSSGWGGLASSALGGAAGFFAGGPSGALAGAKLGHTVGSSF